MSSQSRLEALFDFDPQKWESAKTGHRSAGPLSGLQLGSYSVNEMLGVGTFSSVYRAKHDLLRTDRALKVLRPELNGNSSIVNQFRYEARAMASLDHPGIVRIYDAGFGSVEQMPTGYHYIGMEYLNGMTIADVFSQRRPTLDTTLELVEKISSAVDYAHSRGVVHNDLKPSNIILTPKGEVKVTDFGSAFNPEWTALNNRQIATTLKYIAPEVLAGESPTTKSDIYSLGVITFELITGKTPTGNRKVDEDNFSRGFKEVRGDSDLISNDLENGVFSQITLNPEARKGLLNIHDIKWQRFLQVIQLPRVDRP